jgi:hypothetical protein
MSGRGRWYEPKTRLRAAAPGNGMANVNTETWLIVFVGLTGAAVLLQSIVLLALALSVRKTAMAIREEMAELRGVVTPVATRAEKFLERVGPKMESAATDMAEIMHGLRSQSAEMQASAMEILERARRQTSRVDSMMTGVLDTVDRATAIVVDAVSVPLRQISGMAAFARAALHALKSGPTGPRQQPTHSAADRDMFV